MIVTSKTNNAKSALYEFLKSHGVSIPRSEDFQAIGRINKELALLGVVGYNGFCGRTCMMHVAGDGRWVNREFLWAAFSYPFQQLDVVQVFATVASRNTQALRFNYHLGFTLMKTVVRGWGPDDDLLILTMPKNQCRWLEIKNALKAA